MPRGNVPRFAGAQVLEEVAFVVCPGGEDPVLAPLLCDGGEVGIGNEVDRGADEGFVYTGDFAGITKESGVWRTWWTTARPPEPSRLMPDWALFAGRPRVPASTEQATKIANLRDLPCFPYLRRFSRGRPRDTLLTVAVATVGPPATFSANSSMDTLLNFVAFATRFRAP